jgi:hypothetical protein
VAGGGTPTRADQDAATAAEDWFIINTAIYWHVLPSLILDGVDKRRDQEYIDTLVRGLRAHGRGLVTWADSKAKTTGIDMQTKLILKVQTSKLKEQASLVQLKQHYDYLYDNWELLTTSDRNDPSTFYSQLIISMPSKPEGSHLDRLRIWFAGELRKWQSGALPTFASKDFVLDQLYEEGKMYGIPEGTLEPRSTLAGLDELPSGTTDTLLALYPGSRRTPRERQPGAGRPPRGGGATEHDSKCGDCDAWCCKSATYGTSDEDCVCHHSSKFDITKPKQPHQPRIRYDLTCSSEGCPS